MKILIADDHAVFRRGLMEVLSEHWDNVVFGEAATADDALAEVWKTPWDAMILDIAMPGRSGLDILREILMAQPKLPVLVLSAHSEEQYARSVLEAGAAGFLTKISSTSELISAMTRILAGEAPLGPNVVRPLSKLNPLSSHSHRPLSNREHQILVMLASGLSAKAIAHHLQVAEQTISTHRSRMLKKLDLHSTAELIRYAVQKKLID